MKVNEENTQCQIILDCKQLEQVTEFKYLGYMLNEKGMNDTEYGKKVTSGKKVAGAIKPLVNAKRLSCEHNRVLNESMLLPVLMYDSKAMLSQNYRSN